MNQTLKEAVLVACGRSAIGKGKKGSLHNVHPVDFAGQTLAGTLQRVPNLPLDAIDDVVIGCSKPEAQQGDNLGRIVAKRAGLPDSVPGMTVNRFCSSGLQAISIAANMIMTGQARAVVAGGVESMSLLPMGGAPGMTSEWIDEHAPGLNLSMGKTAELVAEDFGITRQQADAFAVESHRRASQAQRMGYFDDEIIPLFLEKTDGVQCFQKDEGIRNSTSLEVLGTLNTMFRENGVVTAGNASQVSDGAGMVVVMEREYAAALGIRPLARFLGFAAAGVDPSRMGVGPIKAVPRIMEYTGLSVQDMDVIELNEAFAAQAIPCISELKMPPERVNPNGGAIALGHPLGATGAILTCKAYYHLLRTGGRYALITMCIGGGMGAAAVIERLP